MVANELTPRWRNALAWAAVGFVFCGLVMVGAVSLLHDGGLSGFLGAGPVALKRAVVSIAASLIVAAAVVGFSQRNAPLGLRTLRSYLFSNVLAIAGFALAAWAYRAVAATVPPAALDASAKVALILGLTLLVLAIACLVIVGAAHSRAGLLTVEQVEDTRERGRAILYSAMWLATTGVTPVLLSLAGPGGAVAPTTALIGSVVLLGIGAAAGFATRPLLDELWQALSRETGNAGFYLVFVIGGSWAILARLGFLRAPTPLDWLTLLTLSIFAASFIAIGRRGLFKSR
jgi:hypothetical protein